MQTCLIGLHDSGKSTALAALWFSVAERSGSCEWYLANTDRPADASRWTKLRDKWLEATPLGRTEHVETPDIMRLKLNRNQTDAAQENEKLNIVVPDIAGEDFEKLYELGKFPKKHSKLLENSDHLVFFVHVDDYSHPVTLEAPQDGLNETPLGVIRGEAEDWHPDKMHTASKIIGVLMGIKQLRNGNIPKVTVALTAWDLIKDGASPLNVLRQRFPLLCQYLNANVEFRLLGVSAQGCSYQNADEVNNIELDSIERIKIVENDFEHNDITKIFA